MADEAYIPIDDLIECLGDSFRGLWKSRPLNPDGSIGFDRWTVTFIFEGHYVETPDFSEAVDALQWAVDRIIISRGG